MMEASENRSRRAQWLGQERDNRVLLIGPPGAGKSKVSHCVGTVLSYALVRQWLEVHGPYRDVDTSWLFFHYYQHIVESAGPSTTHRFARHREAHMGRGMLASLDAAIAADTFTFHRISTGDVLRDRIKKGSLSAAEVQRMARGQLVSDDCVNSILVDQLEHVGWRNFLLDGYPRHSGQLDHLWETLKSHDMSCGAGIRRPIDHVISVTIDREEADRRILGRRMCPNPSCPNPTISYNVHASEFMPRKSGIQSSFGDYQTGLCDACGTELVRREDDSPEALVTRWELYESEVLPLLSTLRESHWMPIHDVPAQMPPEVLSVRLAAEMATGRTQHPVGL